MFEDEFTRRCDVAINDLREIEDMYRHDNNTFEAFRIAGKIEGVRWAKDTYIAMKKLEISI